MGTDARGLGSGVSLRKVLDLPSSPAHTGLSLEQGSGIPGTCAIPLHPLPDGTYPSSIMHSFLLKLGVLESFSLHHSKQLLLLGLAEHKIKPFPVEWQSIVAVNMGSGDRQMCFSCHICHY